MPRVGLRKFIDTEDGGVTIDWVVITAAVVGLCIAVLSTFGTGLVSTSRTMGTNIHSSVNTLSNPTVSSNN